MLDLLTRAKNAIEVYNTQLRINSANIANMSVAGYKSLKVSFQTIYEDILNNGTAAEAEIGGTNPIQLGSNVGVGNVAIDFTQGDTQEGGNLDLAVRGSGLFVVSPDNGATMLYTRAGRFLVDANGNLVTDNGLQVYGLSGGGLVPITGLNAYDTGRLSWTDSGQLAEYNLAPDGKIDVSSVNRLTGFTIALTSFVNRGGLIQESNNTYAESPTSGTPLAYTAPGVSYGTIKTRGFENSNVFYTGEIIDSMEAQRAMSGNLTILRIISDEISNFINRLSS